MTLRYSPKPVVSAPFGMVLAGGAEAMMGSSAICAAAESYIGLVAAGVGLASLGGYVRSRRAKSRGRRRRA